VIVMVFRPDEWAVRAVTPHHYAASLVSNSPADEGHLLLHVWQRTTGGGRSVRLPRVALVRLALWLRLEPGPESSGALVFCQVVPTGMGHVDVLEAARTADGSLWLKVTHRADDYPQSAWCVVGEPEGRLLGERIVAWDGRQRGGPATALSGPRPVIDVDLPR
jgi:hypothetical protein